MSVDDDGVLRTRTGKVRHVPREPFWKDEQLLGWLTTARVLRVFIAAVVVAVLGLTANAIFLLNEYNRFEHERGASQRDRAAIHREIERTTCQLLAQLPPTGLERALSAQHHCAQLLPGAPPR